MVVGIRKLREDGRWCMGRIIGFQRKHVDKNRIEKLNIKMSEIIGDAEMMETLSWMLYLR